LTAGHDGFRRKPPLLVIKTVIINDVSRPRALQPVAVMLAAIGAALVATVALAAATPAGLAAGGPAAGGGPGPAGGVIRTVAAENHYGNVIAQVGGRYVTVTSLLSNPSTDPHTFEASPGVAREVGAARLVVRNGLGYDSFMDTILQATPSSDRDVLSVQQLLGLPDAAPNPHLWYDPATMPKVADAIAAALARIQPQHAGYFDANARSFTSALQPWYRALSQLKANHGGTPVATTEPVADYFLQAAGMVNQTPWTFQADVMNGVDPSPQDVATVRELLSRHRVRALVYNVQVTDPLTESLITLARASGIPVVGVYETMPQPGYSFQSWMLAEATALDNAITASKSTERL
jgi:zinc/manganese transport system substrate-binding protein